MRTVCAQGTRELQLFFTRRCTLRLAHARTSPALDIHLLAARRSFEANSATHNLNLEHIEQDGANDQHWCDRNRTLDRQNRRFAAEGKKQTVLKASTLTSTWASTVIIKPHQFIGLCIRREPLPPSPVFTIERTPHGNSGTSWGRPGAYLG